MTLFGALSMTAQCQASEVLLNSAQVIILESRRSQAQIGLTGPAER